MTRIETVENMVKTILGDESKVLGTDEYNTLIAKAETEEEIELYTAIYNHLLKKKLYYVLHLYVLVSRCYLYQLMRPMLNILM